MLNLYCFYDQAAGMALQPFPSMSDGEAARHFEIAAGTPESMIHRFPNDFVLMQIGTWDPRDLVLKPLEHGARAVVSGASVMAKLRSRLEVVAAGIGAPVADDRSEQEELS